MKELIEMNLGITDATEFGRRHRVPAQTNSSNNQNIPQTIVCKVTKFKDKQKFLKFAKSLKDTGIFLYENFCRDTMDLRKKLWKKY